MYFILFLFFLATELLPLLYPPVCNEKPLWNCNCFKIAVDLQWVQEIGDDLSAEAVTIFAVINCLKWRKKEY